MNNQEWNRLSQMFIEFNKIVDEEFKRTINLVLMTHDMKDGKGSLFHSCNPQLAEAMIHDAFDHYDASEVDEFIDENKS